MLDLLLGFLGLFLTAAIILVIPGYVIYRSYKEQVPIQEISIPLNGAKIKCKSCSKEFPNHPLNLLTGFFSLLFRIDNSTKECPFCGSKDIEKVKTLNMDEFIKFDRNVRQEVIEQAKRLPEYQRGPRLLPFDERTEMIVPLFNIFKKLFWVVPLLFLLFAFIGLVNGFIIGSFILFFFAFITYYWWVRYKRPLLYYDVKYPSSFQN